MIKAIDFTSKSDTDDVLIRLENGKETTVQKKYVEPVELFETGVYNSEMDVNNNPKTDENTPDKVGAVVDRLTERIKEITFSLEELVLFVKDNSSLSHDSLDKCISELTSYVKSLEDESKQAASSIVN
jgi:hypothetical protein